MTLPILPTTSVGSFPKPEYLTKARFQFSKNQISKTELEELEKKGLRLPKGFFVKRKTDKAQGED